eukprot:1143964-Amphidinium_carterae.1
MSQRARENDIDEGKNAKKAKYSVAEYKAKDTDHNVIRECLRLSEYSIKQYVDKLNNDELVEVSKKTRGWE